jgi:hypothetical protein
MGQKKDEKILELLRKRVIEKDRQLENQAYREATKEALSEMTSLSDAEVEKIYRQVKLEVEEREKKRIKIIIRAAALTLVIGLITFFTISSFMRSPLTFVENFDDNKNNWSFTDAFESAYYLENGSFIIESKKENLQIEHNKHDLNFPKNFIIETEIRKESGDDNNFGIYIGEDNTNFAYFFINSKGQYKLNAAVNGKWQPNVKNKTSGSIKKELNSVNKLKIAVKGNLYEFFINDNFIEKGELYNLKTINYSLAVGGTQKIAFDNLIITNSDTKEVIYSNTFDKELEPWVNKTNYTRKAEFKSGAYEISTNLGKNCTWAQSWFPEQFKDLTNYEIILDAEILKPEKSSVVSLMFMRDYTNYICFEVFEGKKARIFSRIEGKDRYIGIYSAEKEAKDKNISFKVVRKQGEFFMYFNDILVDKITESKIGLKWKQIEKIGLRSCYEQTVAFKNLEFKELR